MNCRWHHSGIVTGPSLTRCTCMSAANWLASHHGVNFAGLGHQGRPTAAALPRCRRLGKARAVAAGGVGRQRELADQQQAATNILHALVHLARRVRKDAQPEDLGQQPVGLASVSPRSAHTPAPGPRRWRPTVCPSTSTSRFAHTLPNTLITSRPSHRHGVVRNALPTSVGNSSMVARRPGTAGQSIARSTWPRSSAAWRRVQSAGMCRCMSTNWRWPARRGGT